jgi:membrane protease subunit (stomatin/prohibitin family)
MGMGMAQMFMNQMNQNQQQNQQQSSDKKMSREEIMDTLKGLGDLKAAGILTDEEFNTKKAELLSRL